MGETSYPPVAVSSGYTKFARIIDSKTSGTSAQSLTADNWTVMELTNIQENQDSIVSALSANAFTIDSTKTTEFIINILFYKQSANNNWTMPIVRLYDVTAGAVFQSHIQPDVGRGVWMDDTQVDEYYQCRAQWKVKISSNNQYRIEVKSKTGVNLGKARSMTSTNEIYKVLDIWGK